MLNPLPALELATLLHSQLIELDGDCGHLANTKDFASVLHATEATVRRDGNIARRLASSPSARRRSVTKCQSLRCSDDCVATQEVVKPRIRPNWIVYDIGDIERIREGVLAVGSLQTFQSLGLLAQPDVDVS